LFEKTNRYFFVIFRVWKGGIPQLNNFILSQIIKMVEPDERELIRHIEENGDPKEIPEIIKKHGGLNYQDERTGNTALMYAIGNNNIEAVKILLESGSNIHLISNNELNALDYSMYYYNYKILELLIEKDRTIIGPNTLIRYLRHFHLYEHSSGVFKTLIENFDFDFGYISDNGFSVRRYIQSHSELNKILEEHIANKEAINNSAKSATKKK
jgi:ankyrin repeat protein